MAGDNSFLDSAKEEAPRPRPVTATEPQIIGSPHAASAKATGAGSTTTEANLGSGICVRLPVLVLAAAATGACIAAGIHVHSNTASLQHANQEVSRLRDENEALAARANLAQREQQDLARLILDPRSRKRLTNMMERSEAFDDFKQRSGLQSNADNTAPLRECLGQLFFELNIASMLDVPCGDGTWQHLIPGIANITYIGSDISVSALEHAKHRPENRQLGMEYMLFDAVHFPLKRAFDLVFFRGAIEQQRIQDSLTAILNFKSSGSKYFAASYWPESPKEANEAAYTLDHNGWYEPNLLLKPFGFPKPLATCQNFASSDGKSVLGIWRMKDLPVTAKHVRKARPDKHRRSQNSGPAQLPRQVHLPPWLQAPGTFAEVPGGHGFEVRRPLRQPHEVSLDDLFRTFGTALAPGRPRQGFGRETIEGDPFDGLFSNFLETQGPVNRGLPTRRSSLPTELFELPGFSPRIRR